MTTIKALITKHPVLTYYALVFAISWGGILGVVCGAGPGGIPGTDQQVKTLMPFALLALFAGPSVAGVLMTAIVHGRTGLREMISRLLKWRVGTRWYAIAILTGPFLVTAILVSLSLVSTDFLPGVVNTTDKTTLVMFGIAWGLIGGGFLEELGWTGFAVPALRLRHGALTTALIVGLLWGAWHFLIAFWASSSLATGQSVGMFVAAFLVFYLAALPAYRVLMVWVYDRTQSLLVAMLMHASLSASTLILQPVATGAPALIWNLALAAALWVIVAAIGLAHAGRLWRPFVVKHPVLTYFALAFAISWGGVLLVIGGPGNMPGIPAHVDRLLPFAVLAMLSGPAVAGILMTGLIQGKAGFRDLLSRLLRWRVGGRWYAVALVGAPVLATAVLLALSFASPAFLPGIYTSDNKTTILLMGIAYGLGAGFFEELGWTGFAIPRLTVRHGVLATGLMVGLPWGAWHFLSNFLGSGDATGALVLDAFLAAQLFAVGALPAYRVLMVWVYDRTGSLLVAMLMHASFTASWLIVMPAGMSGMLAMTWYFVWSAALWVVVAAVGRLSRHPATLRLRPA